MKGPTKAYKLALKRWVSRKINAKMVFHPYKRKLLSITYEYELNGYKLEHVDKANWFCISIQSDLKWFSQINNICNEGHKTFRFLRRN